MTVESRLLCEGKSTKVGERETAAEAVGVGACESHPSVAISDRAGQEQSRGEEEGKRSILSKSEVGRSKHESAKFSEAREV